MPHLSIATTKKGAKKVFHGCEALVVAIISPYSDACSSLSPRCHGLGGMTICKESLVVMPWSLSLP